ncbi:MAG TPA: phosphoglycolate phosphatase [Steroidobacteraceae bacterium]|nr:phosphoglycolate phosphatase [Steroidobacteraceae bacterium]
MARLIERIRAAAFDLDGTLIDTAPDLAAALNLTLATLGRPTLPAQRIPSLIGEGVDRFLTKALTESCGAPPEQESLSATSALFARLYGARLFEESRVYPGVTETLSALEHAGIALCCVTNKHSAFALPLLEAALLREYFAFTLCADRIEDRKPKPGLLLAACTHLAVEPGEMLYVGDSHTDVIAAEAAGCRVLVVDYGYDHGRPVADLGPDRVIGNLLEIVTMQEP